MRTSGKKANTGHSRRSAQMVGPRCRPSISRLDKQAGPVLGTCWPSLRHTAFQMKKMEIRP